MMDTRTIQQERRYTMALGYAWGRKDGAAYGSESGRQAMTTSSLDFATWFAATQENAPEANIERAWEAFSKLHPTEQRQIAEDVKTLPYTGR